MPPSPLPGDDAEPFIGTDEFSIDSAHPDMVATSGKSDMTVFLLLATCGVGLGAFLFGYHMGLPSPAFPFVQEQLGLSEAERSSLVSIIMLGAAAGSLVTGPLSDKVGRRLGVICTCIPLAIGPMIFAVGNAFWSLAIARFITGIGIGGASVLVPMYIAETSPPSVRGALGSSNQLLITVGILGAYLVGFTLLSDENWWRWMSVVAAAIAVLLVLIMLMLPETPHWLLLHDRRPQALAALSRFISQSPRSMHTQVLFADLEKSANVAKSGDAASWGDIFQPRILKLIFVGSTLQVFQQFSGANAMINFSVDIFKRAGYGESASTLASVLVGIVQVVVTLISCIVSDKAGRRLLLFIATITMTFAHALIGAFFYVGTWPGSVAVVGLMVFISAFSIGMGPVPWLICSEIFPQKVRGKAISICTVVNWISNYIVSQTFLTLQSSLTIAGTFWLYGGICILAFLFVLFRVPETKGKTLDEIQEMF